MSNKYLKIVKENSSLPTEGDELFSFGEYIQQKKSNGMGYLTNSEEKPLLKKLFNILWEAGINNKKYSIELENQFTFEITCEEKPLGEHTIFINLVDANFKSLKTLNLWHDVLFVLPQGYGEIDVDDYFCNCSFRPDITNDQEIFSLINSTLTSLVHNKLIIAAK